MNNVQVLLIGDDIEVVSIWVFALKRRGIEAIAVDYHQVENALTHPERISLIAIDHSRQETDALGICRRVRHRYEGPIILFSYESEEPFALQAYEVGADEFALKPIGLQLFMAKIFAWHRRLSLNQPEVDELQVGAFQLNVSHHKLTTPDGEHVRLSELEMRLAYTLLANSGLVMSRKMLSERIWSGDAYSDPKLLKNLVYRLRRKIEPTPTRPIYIHTVEGQGYVFDTAAAASGH